MSREGDRDKFVTLAEKRVNSAIRYIRLIGNLSNRSNYVYTEKDVKKITSALNKEIKIMKEKFENNGSTNVDVFKL